MRVDFWGDRDNFAEILNSFGACTGEYFFLYRYREGLICFSENLCGEESPMDVQKPVCTIEEWKQVVDPRDIDRVSGTIRRMIQTKAESYILNHRVRNRRGETIWINSRCRGYFGQDGTLQYIFGCLTGRDMVRQVSVFGNKELKREIWQRIQSNQKGFLVLMGVDNLKTVNLRRGRDFGDGILEDVGRVIRDELPGDCRIYRFNGDCFAFHCSLETDREICGFFRRIQDRLEGECTVSAGCVSYLDYHVDDGGTLLQYAETAMESSKRHGKNRLTFFLPEDYEKNIRELELREELKYSIEHGFEGFSLCYQAQIATETGRVYGAEALLRYTSKRRGPVSPAEFIPALEQSGLICPVGLWVLREALAACRRWRKTLPDFHISVNMSYVQLNGETVSEDVLRTLGNSGVPGSALTIEVTESNELSDYPHVNELFRRWKGEGIHVSVDDFGTGYSSLSRLKHMEVDEIKIDRCFVRGIQDSAYNYRLISNIIELADSSRICVCCEGVETQEELQALRKLRPRLLQGFLFSHPLGGEEFTERFAAEDRRFLYCCQEETGGCPEMETSGKETAHAAENAASDAGGQTIEERLRFAEKITGYMNALEQPSDYAEAVGEVLASVGDFYQSDRAYLFEEIPSRPGFWRNTFEWCAAGVTSQKHRLQYVAPEALQRWRPIFENNEAVILMNIEPLKETAPLEWKILKRQEIQRLIAVPIRDNGRLVGFVGVDNPRYSIHDDSQIRVLAAFLLMRMRQDHMESWYRNLLKNGRQGRPET